MNRILLRSVREYKKESFLTPVLVCLEVLMEVLIPLLMARIIDVGIMEGDMAYIIKMGLLLILMAMLALVFGAKAGQLGAIASSGYAKNLRHDIFYKIQDFSFLVLLYSGTFFMSNTYLLSLFMRFVYE